MAGKNGGNTVAKVYDIAKPIADELGLSVWDVVYEKEGSLFYLRVFVVKPEGVTMEDVENMTRPLSKALDAADPIAESYVLEVGSPGLGRVLRRPEHFEEYLECPVRIRYIREMNGVKEFIAVMTAYDRSANKITVVDQNDAELEVMLSDTAFVKLCDDEDLFDDLPEE